MYKHYIKLDEKKTIVEGWSTAKEPEKDPSGAIVLRETEDEDFYLFPPDSVFAYALVLDHFGKYGYKYEDGEVWQRTMEELADDYGPAYEPPETTQMRKEITDALITRQINTIDADDATALRWIRFYPEWASDVKYTVDYKARYEKKLYKCRQEHTSQAGWEPDRTPALWALIDEQHAGTADDPIPYDSGMELFEGKYYTQLGVKYRCTRSTGQSVYNALSELVGLYVERVVDE